MDSSDEEPPKKRPKSSELVYEDGDSYSYRDSNVLSEQGDTAFTCINYNWSLNYNILRSDDTTQVKVFVDCKSRYDFADTVSLDIEVEAYNEAINEEFELRKIKTQDFLVDITKMGIHLDKDMKVTCTIRVSKIKYCSDDIGTMNLLTNEDRPHDVVLVVGDTKFYVHKTYVATWSKFFDTLFHAGFDEKDKNEIKIEDVDSKEFETLLELIHPDIFINIDDSNVLFLLKLADRFEMPSVMAKCGSHLKDFRNCPQLSVMKRLELSDRHNLAHLQITCLKKCHEMSAVDFMIFLDKYRERIKELSYNTLKNLV